MYRFGVEIDAENRDHFTNTSKPRGECGAHPVVSVAIAALAVTSAMIGGRWDVSWHESIGRDTFWTPAHMAILSSAFVECWRVWSAAT